MTKFNFKLWFFVAVVLLGITLFCAFKGCFCPEQEFTHLQADSLLKEQAAKYQDSMKMRSDTNFVLRNELRNQDAEIAELKAQGVVIKTVYIERNKEITVSDPDSVFKGVQAALEAFDTETRYDSVSYARNYIFNGVQVKKTAKMINRNNYLTEENGLLKQEIKLKDDKVTLWQKSAEISERRVTDCMNSNNLKDEIIKKLEDTPAPVQNRRVWKGAGPYLEHSSTITWKEHNFEFGATTGLNFGVVNVDVKAGYDVNLKDFRLKEEVVYYPIR
jgi:hypothetical protein